MADPAAAQKKYRESGGKSAANRKLYLVNKEEHYRRNRDNAIFKQYGLTREEYDKIMEDPCRICGEDSKHLDHDHGSGEVRGPLCHRCNVGLGHFRDNPRLLLLAVEHLRGGQ